MRQASSVEEKELIIPLDCKINCTLKTNSSATVHRLHITARQTNIFSLCEGKKS